MWPFSSKPSVFTGRILTTADIAALLPFAVTGKTRYAETTAEYLLWRCKQSKTALSKAAGIMQWASTATCTLFAAKVVTDAAQDYFGASFHTENPAPAVAVFEFWYRPNDSKEGHAIVGAVTPTGLAFVDPQTPDKLLTLTPGEVGSGYHRRFL